jgi:hypothetical protein
MRKPENPSYSTQSANAVDWPSQVLVSVRRSGIWREIEAKVE